MSFPSPSLAVPGLTVGQCSYGGLTFGGVVNGATYQVQSIEGFSPPDVLAADQQRSLEQGEFPGVDVLPGRDFTIVQAISAQTLSALAAARRALGAVLNVRGAEEIPLWAQTEEGVFAIMARPRKHHFPWDSSVFVAKAVLATTMFHATDPRWYLAPSKTATVGAPAPPSGLKFPVAFPASFGGGTTGGILSVANGGGFETRPLLIITGPCTNPSVSNLSLPGSPTLTVKVTLNAGDTLTIDTNFQTVQLVAAGTTAGQSRRNVTTGTWWNLPDEQTCEIAFRTSDPVAVAGTLTVQSADAYTSI